ncbi:MAG: insulinase family protein, partial [Lentisphaeria bacterium]|nr:insulinase family protein [Lentisphaeria bacterium]
MSIKQKIYTRRYSNGFTACIAPCSGIAVQVELCVKTGSINEGEWLGCGLSHFLEHMLFQGCRNYPGRSVSDTVSRLGGNMNAYTSFDRTDYHIFLPARHVGKAIDILTSMVQFPELPEDICKSEKEVILRECDLSLDNPGTMLIRNMIETVYLKHPVRIPVIGFKPQIEQVTREQLLSYHKNRYTPERSFMAIAGNVDPEAVFDLIGNAVANWQQGAPFEQPLPSEEPQYWMRENSFTFSDNLARVAVGLRPCTSSADIAAHNILWGAVGMGSAGLLPVKFMVKDPLALDLRSFDCNIPGGGISAVSAVAKEKDIDKLRSGILKELKKIADGDIPDSAIRQEQTQQYAEKLRRARDIENIAGELVDNFITNGSADTGEYLFNEIMKVTPEDVRRVAAKELDEKLMSVIIQHTADNGSRKKRKSSSAANASGNSYRNGNLYCCTNRDVPLISAALIIPAGPLFDPAGQTGLSSMAIKMLSTGTTGMSEEKLLRALDRCGADFYAQCHANSAICQLTVPKKHFKRAFDILNEQLFSSSFKSDIFEREREKTADVLRHKKLTPLPLAAQRAAILLTSGHPSALGKDGSL